MSRPYVVCSPVDGRMRRFASEEAARRYARRAANETGRPVEIVFAPVTGHWNTGRVVARELPARDRYPDLRADVDLARSIGLED